MGTALVRTDPKGRNYQTLLHEDLFAPLGMDSTSMGLRADLAPRHVKPDMRGTVPIQHLSRNLPGDHALFEDPRRRGPACRLRLDLGRPLPLRRNAPPRRRARRGAHPLAARCCELARQVHTGDMPNELYKRVAENAGWEVAAGQPGHRLPGARHGRCSTTCSARSPAPRPRQLRRRQHDVLGRSRARRQLRAVQRRGDDAGAPISSAARSSSDLALSAHDLKEHEWLTPTSSSSARATTASSRRPISRWRARRCSCSSATSGSAAASSRAS